MTQNEHKQLVKDFLTRKHYPQCDYKDGHSALHVWTSLKRKHAIHKQFNALADAGFVRIRIMPDDDADYGNLARDCFNPKANSDIRPALLAKREDEFKARISHDGVWGIVGEYTLQECDDSCGYHNSNSDVYLGDSNCRCTFEHADSCFGFVGDDWKESGYLEDIMQSTISALRKALQGRCPCCRQGRNVG